MSGERMRQRDPGQPLDLRDSVVRNGFETTTTVDREAIMSRFEAGQSVIRPLPETDRSLGDAIRSKLFSLR